MDPNARDEEQAGRGGTTAEEVATGPEVDAGVGLVWGEGAPGRGRGRGGGGERTSAILQKPLLVSVSLYLQHLVTVDPNYNG